MVLSKWLSGILNVLKTHKTKVLGLKTHHVSYLERVPSTSKEKLLLLECLLLFQTRTLLEH